MTDIWVAIITALFDGRGKIILDNYAKNTYYVSYDEKQRKAQWFAKKGKNSEKTRFAECRGGNFLVPL